MEFLAVERVILNRILGEGGQLGSDHPYKICNILPHNPHKTLLREWTSDRILLHINFIDDIIFKRISAPPFSQYQDPTNICFLYGNTSRTVHPQTITTSNYEDILHTSKENMLWWERKCCFIDCNLTNHLALISKVVLWSTVVDRQSSSGNLIPPPAGFKCLNFSLHLLTDRIF